MRKSVKATSKKLMIAVRKSPHFILIASLETFPAASYTAGLSWYIFFERSLPVISPINGAIIPSVNEVITLPKAPPNTNATAISKRLPLIAKSLNSRMIFM
jgi:hypothetical protein